MWDKIVWRAPLRSLAYVSPKVRREALISIVNEAERAASSGWVGKSEVLMAIEESPKTF